MTYEIHNHMLSAEVKELVTEQAAIDMIVAEIDTDYFPYLILQDDGEITALVWCGVVYRPTNESFPVVVDSVALQLEATP